MLTVKAATLILISGRGSVISSVKEGKFRFGILGQVWYLIVSIPDLFTLTYFNL